MKVGLRLKRLLCFLMSLVVATSLLPGLAFADLGLQGNRSTAKTELKLDETFTVNYCINPVGEVVQRPKVDVSMVLDVSGSMAFKISKNSSKTRLEVMKSSSKIVTQHFREADYGDKVSLVTFSDKAPVTSVNLTTDYTSIDNKINSLTANGGTNISQGLIEGYYKLQNSTNTRYIILLTDGYANYYYDEKLKKNVNNRDKARSEAMKKADQIALQHIPVYTIALASDDGTSDVDTELLEYIANVTGGQAFEATNSEELDKAFSDITKLLSPTIQDIVLQQPLPPGFVLAEDDQSGATVENGVLTKTFSDIPYESVASGRACMSVALKFTGEAGTYEFEKATLSYQVDQQSYSLDIADPLVFTFTDDVIGLEGTASLPAQPTSDQLSNWDIKQAMTVRYDLEPIGRLIRSGAISNVTLTHLLPKDVTTAGTTAYTTVEDRVQLQFTPGDFAFSGGAFQPESWSQSVDLKFAHAGTYSFAAQSGEMKLSYRDNQGADHTVDLTNLLPEQVVVKVFLTDQWNNQYVGDGDGFVTRTSHGGTKQWDVDLGDSPLVDMTFTSDNHDAIAVSAFNGKTAELNLGPSAPDVVIKDRNGAVIAEKDTAYKKGAGTLTVSGSATQLPANTNYYDDAFTSDFIDHYEYRLGGQWIAITNGSAYLDQSGTNQNVEVRAVTKAISGTSRTHASDSVDRIVSLDAEAPHIGEVTADFTGTPGTYKYTFNPNDIYDSHSGLKENGNGEKVYEIIAANGTVQEKLLNENSFTATKEQIGQGMLLRATDQVGWTTDKLLTFPLDQTPPALGFDVENSVTFDQALYTTASDPTLKLSADEDQSGIDSIEYKLDSGEAVHKSYTGDQTHEEISFKLSDRIAEPDARYGKHTIVATVANTDDLTQNGTFSFIVTKAPDVAITVPKDENSGIQIEAKQNTIDEDHVAIQKLSYRFSENDPWIDIADIAGTNKTESRTVSYDGQDQASAATVYVKAVNSLGMETVSQQSWDLDTDGPEIAFDITPKLTQYDDGTAMNQEVLVTTQANPTLLISASENRSQITEVKYQIDSGAWSGNLVTDAGKSQHFSEATSGLANGWHKVTVAAVNSKGLSNQLEQYFFVNTGPEFALSAEGYAENYDFDDSPANKPVVVKVEIPDGTKQIDGSGGYPGVQLTAMEFAVTESADTPAETEWKTLGSTEVTVSKEKNANGEYVPVYVHVRLKQQFDGGNAKYRNITFNKAEYKRIKIVSDQNRY